MRILEIAYKDPECHCGGVEDFVLNLIVRLSGAGHEVTCLYSQETHRTTSGANYRKVNIIKRQKPRGGIPSFFYKVAFNVGAMIYALKHRDDFDAIHINGDNGVFIAPFLGRKSVATFFGLPILRVRDTFIGTRSLKNYPRMFLSLLMTAMHFISLFFSNVVVADNPQIHDLLGKFRKHGDVQLVYNSVDTDYFKPVPTEEKNAIRDALGLDPSFLYAIWIGNDAKGYVQDVAFSIASKYSNRLKLLSVGVRGATDSENIIQLGRLDHKTLAEYFSASDFMIFPQRYPGISLSMVSAMISGLKVVTFSRYLRDFFTDHCAIFANTPEEMEIKVSEILDDPSLLSPRDHAVDPILKEFYPEYCAQKYLELYKRLQTYEKT